MIKVLLVDDHELVRSGVEALLRNTKDIQVVGLAKTGEEALISLEGLNPDVILMDINMPGIGGVEACRRIKNSNPQTKVIALSVCTDGSVPQQLLKLGASGFVTKNSPIDEIVEAIRTVMAGQRYLCSEVEDNLLYSGQIGHVSPFDALSHRESEVVNMILQGKTIKQMSELLSLSDKTINTYRYRLYKKLRVKNDIELIKLAVKYNFIHSV